MDNEMIISNNFYKIKAKKVDEIYIFFTAGIVGILNVLFSTNYTISMAIIFFELCILGYYFLKKDITRYLGFYLIFLCLSFEFEALVGASIFYGFKEFRILGVNLGIIMLLPIVFLTIFKKIKINIIKNNYPGLFRFSKIFFLLNLSGIFFGLLQILINDNNVNGLDNVLLTFVGIVYNMTLIPILLIISFVYLISFENDKFALLEKFMLAILIGVVASMVTSLLTGNFGRYGGINTLLVTNTYRYIPFMLLFPFYKKYKKRKDIILLTLCGIVGSILALLYNSTGKIIILYGLIPIGIMTIFWKRKKILHFFLFLSLVPLIFLILPNVIEHLSTSNIMFKSKLNEIMSILRFWEPNWIENMPLSPRTRIAEFTNIIFEYFHKPWFLIFGKGYMGTIIDHTGLLASEFVPGAFSMNQWNQGIFYGVHESYSLLFLYNGLVGMLFYVFMIKEIFKKFVKSPWILIGGFWFLMVYGYSVTMTAFGVVALLLGFIDYDKGLEEMNEKDWYCNI
jgi:hypothetical protein